MLKTSQYRSIQREIGCDTIGGMRHQKQVRGQLVLKCVVGQKTSEGPISAEVCCGAENK